jgi:ABC-2 type transport system ATP-binding protein
VGEAAVALHDLRKVYRSTRGFFKRVKTETTALAGIHLEIAPGELFGLLGPNGAGKTTMVKILTTLLLPTSGTARILGHDVTRDLDLVRRRIGFVFGGDRGLYTRLSGLDNLRYFADLYAIPPEVSRRRISELLERFELAGRQHDKVERYSRGMKQRLHLARGLLHDPAVLFLDEPTLGLDPVGARELRLLVSELVQRGKTVFLTTHYMFEADEVCDRIAVINKGKIIAEGTPASLKHSVEDVGVVEFEVEGMPPARAETLRQLDGVTSVITANRELTQLVTIHCAQPGELVSQLSRLLEGLRFHEVRVREPTLEDAYVRLVTQP